MKHKTDDQINPLTRHVQEAIHRTRGRAPQHRKVGDPDAPVIQIVKIQRVTLRRWLSNLELQYLHVRGIATTEPMREVEWEIRDALGLPNDDEGRN